MTRGEWLKALVLGLREDTRHYAAYARLLDQQFHAALAHDAAEMRRVGAAIIELAGRLAVSLDARRALAVAVAGRPGPANLEALLARLRGTPRALLSRESARLAACIEQCIWRNERNATLLANQQEIVRQMLTTEDEIYGPD